MVAVVVWMIGPTISGWEVVVGQSIAGEGGAGELRGIGVGRGGIAVDVEGLEKVEVARDNGGRLKGEFAAGQRIR